MNFLKLILTGRINGVSHGKFVRYGRGEYERFLFEITKGRFNFKVKSSYDFANEFVGIIADNIKESAAVSGRIIASYDFKADMDAICETAGYSKRGRLFTAEISAELSPEQLRRIYEKFSSHFLLLNIKSRDFSLKVKKSLPKPGGKIKPDFCSATLPLELLDEFAWDVKQDFTKATIRHILKIKDIIVPPGLKNDPARARLEAKRKGAIVRILHIDGDGREIRKESEFIA